MLKLLCTYSPCYHESICRELAPCVDRALSQQVILDNQGILLGELSSLILTGQVHPLTWAQQQS